MKVLTVCSLSISQLCEVFVTWKSTANSPIHSTIHVCLEQLLPKCITLLQPILCASLLLGVAFSFYGLALQPKKFSSRQLVLARITKSRHWIWLPEKDQECPPFCHCFYLNMICTVYAPLHSTVPKRPLSALPLLWFWRPGTSSLLSRWPQSGSCTLPFFGPIHVFATRKEAGGWGFAFCLRLETARAKAKAPRILSTASKLLQPPRIKLNSSHKGVFLLLKFWTWSSGPVWRIKHHIHTSSRRVRSPHAQTVPIFLCSLHTSVIRILQFLALKKIQFMKYFFAA